jgi:hypothetical protein
MTPWVGTRINGQFLESQGRKCCEHAEEESKQKLPHGTLTVLLQGIDKKANGDPRRHG